jgi:hypothetical protein
MKKFYCKKCRDSRWSDSTPPPDGCTIGSHVWFDTKCTFVENDPEGRTPSLVSFAESNVRKLVVVNTYECSKCKEVQKSNSEPDTALCPQGKHNWVEKNLYIRVRTAAFGVRG